MQGGAPRGSTSAPRATCTQSSARRTARPCPACGGRDATDVHTVALRTPDAHPLQGGYRVVACGACGAGFADVAMRQEFYDRYYATEAKYAEDHRPTASPDEEPDLPAWVRRRFSDIAARMTAQVPHRGRTLDIGCANGTLLDALRTSGWSDLHGVDPSPRSAAIARAKGIAVEVGTFGHLPSWAAPFGCICLTGVLEHVWDVDQAMRDINALLGPDGVVYIEVPDAARYLDRSSPPSRTSTPSTSTTSRNRRWRHWLGVGGSRPCGAQPWRRMSPRVYRAAVVAVALAVGPPAAAGPARVTRDVALVESLVSAHGGRPRPGRSWRPPSVMTLPVPRNTPSGAWASSRSSSWRHRSSLAASPWH